MEARLATGAAGCGVVLEKAKQRVSHCVLPGGKGGLDHLKLHVQSRKTTGY